MNKKLINEIKRLQSLMGVEKTLLNEGPTSFGDIITQLIRKTDGLSDEILSRSKRMGVDTNTLDEFLNGTKQFDQLTDELKNIITEVMF